MNPESCKKPTKVTSLEKKNAKIRFLALPVPPPLSLPDSQRYPPLVMIPSLAQSCSEQDVKYIAQGGRRRGREMEKE